MHFSRLVCLGFILHLARAQTSPVVTETSGAVAMLIDVITPQRPLPEDCEPASAEVTLQKVGGESVTIATCNLIGADMTCKYPDSRYHGIGRGVPHQIRAYNVTVDMAGQYQTIITCHDNWVHQFFITVHVVESPTLPAISELSESPGEVFLSCSAEPRSQPVIYRSHIKYAWSVSAPWLVKATHSGAYGQYARLTTKNKEDVVMNVTCVAREESSSLNSSMTLRVVIPADVRPTPMTPVAPPLPVGNVPDPVAHTHTFLDPKPAEQTQPNATATTLYVVAGVLSGVAIICLIILIIFLVTNSRNQSVASTPVTPERRRSQKTTVLTVTGTPKSVYTSGSFMTQCTPGSTLNRTYRSPGSVASSSYDMYIPPGYISTDIGQEPLLPPPGFVSPYSQRVPPSPGSVSTQWLPGTTKYQHRNFTKNDDPVDAVPSVNAPPPRGFISAHEEGFPPPPGFFSTQGDPFTTKQYGGREQDMFPLKSFNAQTIDVQL